MIVMSSQSNSNNVSSSHNNNNNTRASLSIHHQHQQDAFLQIFSALNENISQLQSKFKDSLITDFVTPASSMLQLFHQDEILLF